MPTVVVLAEEVQPMLVLQGHDALDSAHALGGPASRQPWAQHRGATTSTHKVNAVTTGRQPDVHHSRSANPPQGWRRNAFRMVGWRGLPVYHALIQHEVNPGLPPHLRCILQQPAARSQTLRLWKGLAGDKSAYIVDARRRLIARLQLWLVQVAIDPIHRQHNGRARPAQIPH